LQADTELPSVHVLPADHLDGAAYEKVALASRRMGEELAAWEGKDWRAIIVAELERRITEVNATGQQLWCQDQFEIPCNRPLFKRKA
jgi:hypothetical protein